MSLFKWKKETQPDQFPVADHSDDVDEPSAVEQTPDPVAEPALPTRTPELHASREILIGQAYERWHAELAELVQRADQREAERSPGRIDLTQIHPTGSAQFYAYQATRLSSLIREERALAQAKTQLLRLRDELHIATQTYGHAPASLAVGVMTWTELPEPEVTEALVNAYTATGELQLSPENYLNDLGSSDQSVDDAPTQVADSSAAEPDTPPTIRQARVIREVAVYRPVRLFFHDQKDALIQLTPAVDINTAVIRALRNHGAVAEELANLRQLASEDGPVDVLITRLTELGRIYLPGFTYEPHVTLGSFFQPERTMLADLEAMEPYIRTSGTMLALAGDEEARQLSSLPLSPGNPKDRHPEQERGVGDLDPAELDVVEAVAAGRSIVVDCPPGSQRYETMAAIAADTVASGRSLIVVPSRASSAAQLVAELDRRGLGSLVADFSDVEAIPMRLRTGMRVERPDLPTDETLERRTELMRVRTELETFMYELHDVDPHWGVSVYDLLEKLAASTQGNHAPVTKVRFDAQTLDEISGENLESIYELLTTAGHRHAFDPEVAHSAWNTTDIADPALGNQALDAVRRLHEISIPAVVAQSSRAAGETGLRQADTVSQWREQIEVLDGISQSLDIFLPQIFETSAMDMVIASASRQWREANGYSMRGSERRRFKKQAQDLIRPGVVVKDLHAELLKVQERRETWRRYTAEGGWPQLPQGLNQIRSTSAELFADLDFLSEHLGGENFFSLEFAQLEERIAHLATDAPHMAILPERNAALNELRSRGLGRFLDDMIARAVRAESIEAEFELAYWSSVFEQLIVHSTSLAHLGPQDLSRLLRAFRDLDTVHCESMAGPVKFAVVNNARSLMIDRRNDTLKLDSMLASSGVSVLRDVIATYQRLVQVARPIWIVPATIAAEFIPPMPWVDVVMMDISDNATVASVASSMTRGRQVVAMGDVRRAQFVERENGVMRALSAVLPVRQLPANRIKLDDLSIRTLRNHGYDDVLVDIPSVSRSEKSKLVVVDGRGVPSASGNGAVVAPKVEVDAVVEAILSHAMDRPDESLAVITVSSTHAQRIRDALRHVGTHSAELSQLYSGHNGEPFVVVDIMAASGIRRDHVILSVGYGKTVHGRVLHSFGMLSTPAGFAGMIDAIEAARASMTIISSIAPGEISFNRVTTPGPRLLADLLSEAGGYHSQSMITDDSQEVAPLLADLAQRIEAAGFVTRANVGSGQWRIPLVVGHPKIRDQWAVAVMYDDNDYTQIESIRRRDRHRFATLEAHGWAVYQTFSTSLFVDPQGEAQRVIDLVYAATDLLHEPSATGLVHSNGEEDQDSPLPHSTTGNGSVARARGQRPAIMPGLQIAGYTDNELEDLITWIASDGIERNVTQYVTEVRHELALRRGSQIERVLANIVRRMGVARDGE
ncbi:hypothetical protein [Arcanobacterium pinnipediorum]|uniref:Restriction endonuclease type II-like domain-containing protein n=1 Tax=Arcanobacterium pinnipediorum TaxID=1503041 RepID=A0ABY5AHB5_9ACTO|nr:hypothetical protein [Arcanobacterium pinnipediorum]USR79242.1 hypothetical protein NG665_07640 [Arcanobacterium pinnipediorum]